MTISFIVDKDIKVSNVVYSNCSPKTSIEMLTNSNVEACGATSHNVIGRINDPSIDAEHINFLKHLESKGRKYKEAPKRMANPFVQTLHLAYAEHYPLTLSPDHIWLAIAQGFAKHVNLNAESLRHKFVSHDGKKLIKITRNYFIKGSPDNDWQGCFSEFSDQISESIGKKRDLVVSNFSTTSAIEKATSEIVLMDAMKSYFKYAVQTMCGIQSVTLLGTVKDWESVYTRAENLSEFDLGWWINPLLPVLKKIVETAEGNPDLKFWSTIYKQSGGSGGPYCSGWFNTLFPYLEDYNGNPRKNFYLDRRDNKSSFGGPTMDNYSSGLSVCPFKWEYYSTVYDMSFIGGFVGTSQNEDLEVTPTLGWAVKDNGTSKDGPLDKNEDW